MGRPFVSTLLEILDGRLGGGGADRSPQDVSTLLEILVEEWCAAWGGVVEKDVSTLLEILGCRMRQTGALNRSCFNPS